MSLLNQALTFLGIGPSRNFAGFSGYVTVTEDTVDEIEITQQPVQQGASIADHAYKKPIGLSIQIQFNTSLLAASLADTYAQLLALQSTFVPFDVTTPKRVYSNMMLKMLKCTTNKQTENILAINCTFQEALIVFVDTAAVPLSQLKNPKSNAATQKAGNKSGFKILLGANTVSPGSVPALA